MLFHNNIKPALVEGNDDRQVYDLTTNNTEFRLFIKYRTDKQNIITKDYNSWVFILSENDRKEILYYLDSGYNLIIALACGVKGLIDSELAMLDKHEIKQIIDLQNHY